MSRRLKRGRPFKTGDRVRVKGLESHEPPMLGTVEDCLAFMPSVVMPLARTPPKLEYRVIVAIDKGDPLGRWSWSGPVSDVELLRGAA